MRKRLIGAAVMMLGLECGSTAFAQNALIIQPDQPRELRRAERVHPRRQRRGRPSAVRTAELARAQHQRAVKTGGGRVQIPVLTRRYRRSDVRGWPSTP